MAEREEDKKIIQAEGQRYDLEHQNRQKYFDRLKDYQKANDLKQKLLESYMSHDHAKLSSSKDEQNYIKHIEEEQRRAMQKEIKDKQIKLKKSKDNYSVLDQQIREKEMEKLSK